MNSKRALITGVTGFTGVYLFDALVKRDWEVEGISLNARNGFLRVDLTDPSSVRHCLERYQPTHIVHLAGQSFPGHADTAEIYAHNVSAAANLLAALPLVKNLSQVIMASSAAVYGITSGQDHVDEMAETRPTSHYGVSKLCMEMICRIYARDYPITIVRPFNYIGVGQRQEFFVPKIINAFRKKQAVLSVGNLDVIRDFSDVRDVVEVYIRLMEAACINEVLNICSGRGLGLRDIVNYISQLTNHKVDLVVDPQLVRPNEPEIMVGVKERLEGIVGPVVPRDIYGTLQWIVEAGARHGPHGIHTKSADK